MELLDRALKPMVDFLVSHPYGTHYVGSQKHQELWKKGFESRDEVSVNIRLDWELDVDSPVNTEEKFKELMLIQISDDLKDMVENGDVLNANDALLKSFDGAKKRGKRAVEFEIIGAQLHKQLRFRSNGNPVNDYNLYIRPYIRWA